MKHLATYPKRELTNHLKQTHTTIMPSKLKKAIGAVKDNTSIGLAKVGSSTSVSDLEVAVVKATRHVEYPAEEKHIREILSLTSYSRAYVSTCVSIIARRLNKTKNWNVALKTLMLIHRLLSEGDPSYEPEIFFATRRGTRLLNLSDFRDNSQSNSWDFSAFVRTYALYLDEKLEFRMQGRRGKRSAFVADEDEDLRDNRSSPGRGGRENDHKHDRQVAVRATPVREMKADQLFSRGHHLQQLLERVLACRPTGAAKVNRLVIVALYPIVKESFQVYYEITEIMSIMIDQFMEMQVPDCVKVHDSFARISKQFDELDGFYGWCKTVGIARSSEYPEVEKISQKKLDVMDEFIKDKSAMGRKEDHEEEEEKKPVEEETKKPEEEVVVEEEEEDMNKMKALPPPEGFEEEKVEIEEEEKVNESQSLAVVQQEADLLNLGADAPTTEQHADSLALALFDGLPKTNPAASSAPAWQAFATEENWEEALVQSASHLSNQPVSLAGGFDMLLLDGMYQQQAVKAATMGAGATGSASSVAIGSAGKPAMLALPAPPASSGSGAQQQQPPYVDPFAASLVVPPPAYVQMSEMEKKQKLLMEEKLMWQQYGRDQMQGHLAYHNVQTAHQNPYNTGNYQQRF